MFYILETEQQLKFLERFYTEKVFTDFIPDNDLVHPYLTEVISIYLHPESCEEGYIIPIKHNEGLKVEESLISQMIFSFKQLYIWDKRYLCPEWENYGRFDVQILASMKGQPRLEEPLEDPSIKWFYSRLGNGKKVNSVIPVSKLYERSFNRYKSVQKLLSGDLPQGFEFYNTKGFKSYQIVENHGIGVFSENFSKENAVQVPLFNVDKGRVYTKYNFGNITSRPTNSFNGVNFLAIPKTENCRKVYRPVNDLFIEFDFDGYHLRLICEQIGYRLSSESAHIQIGRTVYGKEDLTEEELKTIKNVNFHAIYGKIPPQYAFYEFFEKLGNFIETLWIEFNQKGFIEDPISRRKYFKEYLPDMHKYKLMNYFVQSLETSRNIEILSRVVEYLKDKKSKVVLVTYDAITVDFAQADGLDTLEELEKLLDTNSQFPVRVSYGKNFNFTKLTPIYS